MKVRTSVRERSAVSSEWGIEFNGGIKICAKSNTSVGDEENGGLLNEKSEPEELSNGI